MGSIPRALATCTMSALVVAWFFSLLPLFAQTNQEEQVYREHEDGVVEDGVARRSEAFAASVEGARSSRSAALAEARARYERTIAAIRSATTALTTDARARVDEGPLRNAQKALSDAMDEAERRFDRAILNAVESHGGPAVAVFSAAADAIAEVRTGYEIYAAVVAAADAALGLERTSSQSALRTGRSAEVESREAEAELARAQRAYASAQSERDAAKRARPADPNPGTGDIVAGTLAAGLAEVAGDHSRADAIRGQLEREQSRRLGDHSASVERYDARLGTAEGALEAARRELDVALQRHRVASALNNAARRASTSADAGYGTAYEARIAAGIDAARMTPVHTTDELKEMTRSIQDGGIVAITEVETDLLSRLPPESFAEAFEAAIADYARPRLRAIEAALQAIENGYTAAIDSAESEYGEARTRASSGLIRLGRVLDAHARNYQQHTRAADSALETALVQFYSKGVLNQHDDRNVRAALRRAGSAHRGAIGAALTSRRNAISRDFPAVRSLLADIEARHYKLPAPNDRIYGGTQISAQGVVRAVRSYKDSRARSDAGFKEDVENTYMRAEQSSTAAVLEAARERVEAARRSAQLNVVANAIQADRGRAERLRHLGAAIQAGLRAAEGQAATEKRREEVAPRG